MKILFTGDNHLCKTLYGSLAIRQWSLTSFARVVTYAVHKDIDMFVQCGDLLNEKKIPPDAQHILGWAIDELQKKDICIGIVEGNHDTDHLVYKKSPAEILSLHHPEIVFEKERIFSIAFDDAKVNIVFLNFNHSVEFMKKQLKECSDMVEKDYVNILVSHIPIDEELPPGLEGVDRVSYNDLPWRDFKYVFLGDIHKPLVTTKGDCTIFYTGATMHKDIKDFEEQPLSFLMYDSEKNIVDMVEIPRFKINTIEAEEDITEKNITGNFVKYADAKLYKSIAELKPLYAKFYNKKIEELELEGGQEYIMETPDEIVDSIAELKFPDIANIIKRINVMDITESKSVIVTEIKKLVNAKIEQQEE